MLKINEIFKELKQQAKEYYHSLDKIKCPALDDYVIFNSEGFHHLRYNSSLSERSKFEQRNKFAYLPEAVEIIKKTTTIQEIREFLEPVGLKDQSGFRKTVKVTYYAFWAMHQRNIRIKVIVRKIEDGQYSFRSLMPYWFEKKINGKLIRYFSSPKIQTD